MTRRKSQDHALSRRAFLCRSACASMGVTGLVNTLAHLQLIQRATAAAGSTQTFKDYKAMVCVFLSGGNDSNNMLIPLDGVARANYDKARSAPDSLNKTPWSTIHIPTQGYQTAAIPLTTPEGGYEQAAASQFGVHPRFGRVAKMFNEGDLAFVSNVGTLVQPIPNLEAYANPGFKKPPQLFSHSDQQIQWQSSIPDKPFQTGWAGRVMDQLIASRFQENHDVSMNISLNGYNRFQIGRQNVPYSIAPTGISTLMGFNDPKISGTYSAAIKDYGGSTFYNDGTEQGRRLWAFDTVMNLTHEHLLDEGYNTIMRRARRNEEIMNQVLAMSKNPQDIDINGFFKKAHEILEFGEQSPIPNSSLASQLSQVAKLMKGRKLLGKETGRQIFFVAIGGFDTHQGQAEDIRSGQNLLLAQIDRSLEGFKNALVEMGLWDSTVLFTNSDFARTFVPNGSTGDAGTGTDHAWGGHQIVAGGPVAGGKVFGQFPDLSYDTNDKANCRSTSAHGSWIPSTSVDQYSAVIARWFGVPDDLLAGPTGIFPNLSRFNSGSNPAIPDDSANLAFLKYP